MEIIDPQPDIFDQSSLLHPIPTSFSNCACSFPPTSLTTTTTANSCLKCTNIAQQPDITSDITKQAVLHFCKTCKSYLRPPWVRAELESKELLAICLRRIQGLNKVKLLDASFIWTEPHSRRIKVKLTVERELMDNVTAQQTVPIEFVVLYQQCEECKKEYSSDNWGALVQIRQKADHKKTLFFIEQIVLKYNVHDKVLNIKELQEGGGLDFFYKEKSHAQRLVDFLQTMLPIRVKHSKQPISQQQDKYIFNLDLPRVCKDDLVFLPPRVREALGGCSALLICWKVSTMVTFIDPVTMKTIELSSTEYFKYEDELSVIPCKRFAQEFAVFNIGQSEVPKYGNNKVKNLTLGRVNDWKNFNNVKTHLGDILKEGSYVMGYDISSMNLSGYIHDNSMLKVLPEVILVKKISQEGKDLKKRIWKLRQLEKEGEESEDRTTEYEDFLDELEADPEMRSFVNMYRNENAIKEKEKKKIDKMVDETEDKENPNKSLKKKLKVKRNSKNGNVLAATGGQENNNNNNGDDDRDQDENKDNNGKKKKVEIQEKKEEKDEDDAMVRIEELLADLTLEDQIVEDNDDAIDEFISRLENIKIEGKE